MPTPGQMNEQQKALTAEQAEMVRGFEAHNRQYSGAIRGAGNSLMSQDYSALLSQIAGLRASVDALRDLLSPPSAVILTGSEVTKHFHRLSGQQKGE